MTMRFNGPPGGYAIGAFASGVGNIRPGDKGRFYDAGGGLTPRAIYSDAALTTPIAQPIVADSAGRWATDGDGNFVNDIFLQSGLYKFVWTSSADAAIRTWDNVDPGLSTGGSGGILGIAEGGTSASTAGGALAALGAASQAGLDTEIADRQALDVRVVVLETASAFLEPGHRLTLSSGVPVLGSDVVGAGTIYLSPYKHNRIPLWDGSAWGLVEFDEVSQTLADTTKSPAGGATNSAYDMFAWLDGVTPMCTRGPAWQNVTTRNTGAGTTELEQIDGVWVNKQNITNGPVARAGRYMGTVVTDGSTQCSMMFAPNAAAGGSANRLDVWNMYNRIDFASLCRDSTNTWASANVAWRSFNASTANRVTFVRGFAEDRVRGTLAAMAINGNNAEMRAGIGLDATDTLSGIAGRSDSTAAGTNVIQIHAHYVGNPSAGQHFLQALDGADGTGSSWIGDNGAPTTEQSGFIVELRA